MKRPILASIVLLAVTLSSCVNYNYLQVYEVQSENCRKQYNTFIYNNEDCNITYNLWSEGGGCNFSMTNNTNNNMFVIMPLSALIVNNEAKEYDSNLLYSTDYTNPRITANVVCIPPKSKKTIKGKRIIDNVLLVCDDSNSNFPKKQSENINYTRNVTPLLFNNRIAYCFDSELKDIKYIENTFWVSSLQNYSESHAIKKITACVNGFSQKIKKYKMESPDKFYIKYMYEPFLAKENSMVKKRKAADEK